jgi:hypothetical protein
VAVALPTESIEVVGNSLLFSKFASIFREIAARYCAGGQTVDSIFTTSLYPISARFLGGVCGPKLDKSEHECFVPIALI